MNHPSSLPKPVRYIVRHYTERLITGAAPEEVIVSYSADLPEGYSYAISTASRYRGSIFADYEDGNNYSFIKSYTNIAA